MQFCMDNLCGSYSGSDGVNEQRLNATTACWFWPITAETIIFRQSRKKRHIPLMAQACIKFDDTEMPCFATVTILILERGEFLGYYAHFL